jgi:phage terminase large subunit-like protein
VDLSSLADIDVAALDETEIRTLLIEVEAAARAEKYGKFHSFFPPKAKCTHVDAEGKSFIPGPPPFDFYAREHYPKHLELIRATKDFSELLFIAANRVGKTELGAYCSTTWLTGDYADWWEGRRWTRPVRMWAAGDFNETTRDVIQKKMLGGVEWFGDKKGVDGTGMVPRDLIHQDSITWKAGVPDLVDTVRVDWKSPSGPIAGTSVLGLKSYQQGRRSFQGTEQDIIWTDEEPPMDVYGEMLIRLMTTKGLALLTFTPLNGWSDVVEAFYPDRKAMS